MTSLCRSWSDQAAQRVIVPRSVHAQPREGGGVATAQLDPVETIEQLEDERSHVSQKAFSGATTAQRWLCFELAVHVHAAMGAGDEGTRDWCARFRHADACKEKFGFDGVASGRTDIEAALRDTQDGGYEDPVLVGVVERAQGAHALTPHIAAVGLKPADQCKVRPGWDPREPLFDLRVEPGAARREGELDFLGHLGPWLTTPFDEAPSQMVECGTQIVDNVTDHRPEFRRELRDLVDNEQDAPEWWPLPFCVALDGDAIRVVLKEGLKFGFKRIAVLRGPYELDPGAVERSGV